MALSDDCFLIKGELLVVLDGRVARVGDLDAAVAEAVHSANLQLVVEAINARFEKGGANFRRIFVDECRRKELSLALGVAPRANVALLGYARANSPALVKGRESSDGNHVLAVRWRDSRPVARASPKSAQGGGRRWCRRRRLPPRHGVHIYWRDAIFDTRRLRRRLDDGLRVSYLVVESTLDGDLQHDNDSVSREREQQGGMAARRRCDSLSNCNLSQIGSRFPPPPRSFILSLSQQKKMKSRQWYAPAILDGVYREALELDNTVSTDFAAVHALKMEIGKAFWSFIYSARDTAEGSRASPSLPHSGSATACPCSG